jgi:hypothetical protein
MVAMQSLRATLSVGLLLSAPGVLGHPCEEAIASACPDRPGSEIAACLKDTEQHEAATVVSSECTDFIAVHTACADEIENLCDEAWFNDDTVACLTEWISESQRSERCSGVLTWAVPEKEEDDEDDDGPTDEIGMSEKDHAEKKEWQAKRKANRDMAAERLKMKEIDRQKEEDRVALEKFKSEDPEGYAAMLQQQEEERRQQAEFKRLERARAAAYERKRREELGITEEDDEAKEKAKKEKQEKKEKKDKSPPQPDFSAPKSKGSAFAEFIGLVVVFGIIGTVLYVYKQGKGKGKRGKMPAALKKRI